MWPGDEETPPSEDTYWRDLSPEEKAAATRLCYTEETWDDVPISMYYDYERGTTTAVNGKGPVPNDIDLNIFEETGYVGKPPGSVGAGDYTTDSSYRAIVSSNVLGLMLSVGAFLFI